ncbi:MAG: thrombospondin type 3 repeat-containing protein, partial [Kiritimatiellae bacterium]|nr:thrombospondin type 3 repeat-containing protein [Kiritimatiellia bacterium]
LASSPGGKYTDIRIVPLSNGLARVSAFYTASGVRELRVFEIEVDAAQNSEDLDGDGIPNALERALGTDPWLADPTELDMALADGYLYLGYTYDPRVEDAAISVNATTNLLEAMWTPSEGTLLYREPLPDQREEVLYRIPLQPPAGFYRLKLDVP